MENLEIKHVGFLGSDLVAARDDDGTIWAGISYICNGMGLNKAQKDNQIEKIRRDKVLLKGCRKFPAGVFDKDNNVYALKLEFVPLWLAKINITPTMQAETPELAERLEAYQLKAKDVLAAAFLGLPIDYPSALRALADQVEKNHKLESEVQNQQRLIESFEPIKQYVDTILESKDSLAVTQIAKDYGMSAKQLNRILTEEGIQYKVNKQWVLYSKYAGKGYTDSKTYSFTHSNGETGTRVGTCWTQKGRLLIHELLQRRGIEALMDRKDT